MQLIVTETVLIVTIPSGRKGSLDGIGVVSVHRTFVQSLSRSQRW